MKPNQKRAIWMSISLIMNLMFVSVAFAQIPQPRAGAIAGGISAGGPIPRLVSGTASVTFPDVNDERLQCASGESEAAHQANLLAAKDADRARKKLGYQPQECTYFRENYNVLDRQDGVPSADCQATVILQCFKSAE